MGQVKHIRHAADLLVGIDQLRGVFIVARETRCELAPVLQVDQHIRNQLGYGALVRLSSGVRRLIQPVYCGNAAFIMDRI